MLSQALFSIPHEYIDRNIIPFAKYEFKELIESCGDIRGAIILKSILDFESIELTADESEMTYNIKQVIAAPKETLLKKINSNQKIFMFNVNVRTIFIAQLLLCLQKHYFDLAKLSNNSEPNALAWIPDWTTKKSRLIQTIILGQRYKTLPEYGGIDMLITSGLLISIIMLITSLNYKDNPLYLLLSLSTLQLLNKIRESRERERKEQKAVRTEYINRFGDRALNLLTQIEETYKDITASTLNPICVNTINDIMFNHQVGK